MLHAKTLYFKTRPAGYVVPELNFWPTLSAVASDRKVTLQWVSNSSHTSQDVFKTFDKWNFRLFRIWPEQPTGEGYAACANQGELIASGTGKFGFVDEPVQNGVSYTYKLVGIDPDSGQVFEEASDPTIPASSFTGESTWISSLTAVAFSSSAELTWGVLSGAAGYDVEESIENGGEPFFNCIAHVPAGAPGSTTPLHYVRNGLRNDVSYRYRIIAKSEQNDTSRSNPVLATPKVNLPPAPPSGFVGTYGSARCVIQWSESGGADYYRVSSYSGGWNLQRMTKTPSYEFSTSGNGEYRLKIEAIGRGGGAQSNPYAEIYVRPLAWTMTVANGAHRSDVFHSQEAHDLKCCI